MERMLRIVQPKGAAVELDMKGLAALLELDSDSETAHVFECVRDKCGIKGMAAKMLCLDPSRTPNGEVRVVCMRDGNTIHEERGVPVLNLREVLRRTLVVWRREEGEARRAAERERAAAAAEAARMRSIDVLLADVKKSGGKGDNTSAKVTPGKGRGRGNFTVADIVGRDEPSVRVA